MDKFAVKIAAKLDLSTVKNDINKLEKMLKNTGKIRLSSDTIAIDDTDFKASVASIFKEIAKEQSELAKVSQTSSKEESKSNTSSSLKDNIASLSKWFGLDELSSKTSQAFEYAIGELKETDTVLTGIAKTSGLSKKSLDELGASAAETANKYGTTIRGYLNDVQEMTNAGFSGKQAEGMAGLSSLAQSASGMTADLASSYLIASDKAYGYGGNVKKLNALLDSQNQVTKRNSVSLAELADATKVAANELADMGVEERELTALLGTGIAASGESGEAVGQAVKSILMNLQQISGDTGDGEIIDEDSLKKVEERCHSVGIGLESIRNGIVTLRDPMEVLRELADVYNSLPENSADRIGIASDIGGKDGGNVLSGILSNWNTYEKMLGDYENSAGSAMNDAIKTADSWEGALNRLSNTWVNTVGNIANSDAIIAAINNFNGFLTIIQKVTGALGSFDSIAVGLGAILNFKNVGRAKSCPSNRICLQ